mmetsp:Transcript_86479/g.232012  ORF Transcript_86479/g.232012 Transcript_86479/m.232012 type:complete len:432 (+) Transcript_86479:249-1544(+)
MVGLLPVQVRAPEAVHVHGVARHCFPDWRSPTVLPAAVARLVHADLPAAADLLERDPHGAGWPRARQGARGAAGLRGGRDGRLHPHRSPRRIAPRAPAGRAGPGVALFHHHRVSRVVLGGRVRGREREVFLGQSHAEGVCWRFLVAGVRLLPGRPEALSRVCEAAALQDHVLLVRHRQGVLTLLPAGHVQTQRPQAGAGAGRPGRHRRRDHRGAVGRPGDAAPRPGQAPRAPGRGRGGRPRGHLRGPEPAHRGRQGGLPGAPVRRGPAACEERGGVLRLLDGAALVRAAARRPRRAAQPPRGRGGRRGPNGHVDAVHGAGDGAVGLRAGRLLGQRPGAELRAAAGLQGGLALPGIGERVRLPRIHRRREPHGRSAVAPRGARRRRRGGQLRRPRLCLRRLRGDVRAGCGAQLGRRRGGVHDTGERGRQGLK